MTEIDRLIELITTIYDAPLKPSGWSPLAAQLADLFGADGCQVQAHDLARNSVRTISESSEKADLPGPDPALIFKDYAGKSPNPSSMEIALIEIIHDSLDSIDKRPKEDRINISHFAADVSKISSSEFTVIGLHRAGPPLTPEQKRWMEILVVHLQRALKIQSKLSLAKPAAQVELDILHAIRAPVLLVDEQARIVFSNEMAEKLLAKADGIRNVAGTLQAVERGAAARLLALVGSATSGGMSETRNCVLAVPRQAGRPLSLIVAPLPRAASAGAEPAFALIMIGDPDRRARPALAALADLYGLTRAEAKLLDSLLAGERLQEYAEHAGLSINTAKTQLAQLFQKTGHSRQSDLLREIGADPIWTLM
jgi:DNA-binding CsgD family transcriptional regulator